MAGENSAAWANATISATVWVWLTGWVHAAMGVGGGWESSMCHKPLVAGNQVPCKMVVPWWSMVRVDWVKLAVHPWSHSCLMERRDVSPIIGKIWPVQAAGGRDGRWRSTSWVEAIVSLLGRATMTGCSVGHLLV